MDNYKKKFNEIELLDEIFKKLDISETNYKKAVDSYTAVGKYLLKELGDGTKVYPQGSFLYGTVTRPYFKGKDVEYDIDLVCEYEPLPDTADKCKNSCGDALKASEIYEKLLKDKEGRRCWTLEYAKIDEINFHIDILPSKHVEEERIQEIIENGVAMQYAQTAIMITTKTDDGYKWDESNPKGYKAWLDDITSVYMQEKRALFEASVERVPGQYESKTAVHRVIQILKRHRDIRFDKANMNDIKPISMIITTLAARVAEANTDKSISTFELLKIVIKSADRIKALNEQQRFDAFEKTFIIKKENGEWEILNPVNPEENFADKWHENGAKKARAFFQWVDWLKQDLLEPLMSRDSIKAFMSLSEGLGTNFMREIYDEMKLPWTELTLTIVTKDDTKNMPKPWRNDEKK